MVREERLPCGAEPRAIHRSWFGRAHPGFQVTACAARGPVSWMADPSSMAEPSLRAKRSNPALRRRTGLLRRAC